MGTTKGFRTTQAGRVICTTCGKTYSSACDWRQGRCPHRRPIIDLEKFMHQPDAKKHFQLSMIKSAVRIAAGIALIWPQSMILAGAFLIVAEVIGVAEEMV